MANTLVTKTAIPISIINRSLEKLDQLNFVVIRPVVEELKIIAKFAKTYHVSVYDATYAVLAQEKNCDLITADSKFADRVNLPFVKHLTSVNINS